MPSKLKIKDTDVVIYSQWPWKKQEIFAITFFALVPFVTLAILMVTDNFTWTIFGAIGGIGAVVAVYLWWVAKKRKKNSRFTAVLTPSSSLLQVEGKIPATGREVYSKIDLNHVDNMSIRPLGINAAFILVSPENKEGKTQSLIAPYRVIMKPELKDVFIDKMKDVEKSFEAEKFYNRLVDNVPPSNYKHELRSEEAKDRTDWSQVTKNM